MTEIKPTSNEDLKKNIICQEPIQTLFVDGLQGLGVSGGTVRINLIEDKLDPQQTKIIRHVVMRLIMPVEVLDSFIEKLSDIRDRSKISSAASGEVQDAAGE